MSYTYLLTNTIGKVRLEIGDNQGDTNKFFSDEEIQVKVDDRGDDVLLVSADLCDILATRFAAQADTELGDQSIKLSTLSDAFAARADRLRTRAAGSGIGVIDQKRVDGYSQTIASKDVSTLRTRRSVGEFRGSVDIP
jgi:hypothetical protein